MYAIVLIGTSLFCSSTTGNIFQQYLKTGFPSNKHEASKIKFQINHIGNTNNSSKKEIDSRNDNYTAKDSHPVSLKTTDYSNMNLMAAKSMIIQHQNKSWYLPICVGSILFCYYI